MSLESFQQNNVPAGLEYEYLRENNNILGGRYAWGGQYYTEALERIGIELETCTDKAERSSLGKQYQNIERAGRFSGRVKRQLTETYKSANWVERDGHLTYNKYILDKDFEFYREYLDPSEVDFLYQELMSNSDR